MPDPATPPENEPAALPQPRRSPRRALLAAIVLPGTLLLGMLWLLASEAGLTALAALAGRVSGNSLVIDGAQGRLLGPLRFAELRFDGAHTRIRARDIALDWRLQFSPERRLIFPQVGIGALDLTIRPSDTPPALPADLALPLALQIDRLHIDRLRLQGWLPQSAAPAPNLIEIENIAARMQSDGRHHQLTELHLSTPFASVNGKATLDVREAIHARSHNIRSF